MKRVWTIIIVACITLNVMAQKERFCIADDGKTATIIVDVDDWKGVIRAARDEVFDNTFFLTLEHH